MKKIFIYSLFLVIICSNNFFSQIFNLNSTRYGYIFTDEMSSTIYLLRDNKIEELVSAPGCGNYLQISENGKKVGFKLIENGLQIPCVIDLDTKKNIRLNSPMKKCGQVSFDTKGNPAFTVDKDFYYIKNEQTKIFHLGYYANIAPISPDGNYVVFNDEYDQLWLLNLENLNKEKITNDSLGYYLPRWAPNSEKILFSSFKGDIYVFDLNTKTTKFIDEGISAIWSKNYEQIYYIKQEVIELVDVISSDIYCYDFNNDQIKQLTNTPDILENSIIQNDDDSFLINRLNSNEINISNFDNEKLFVQKSLLIPEIQPKYFANTETYKTTEVTAIDVPYIHQVYDTPPWHDGHWSCAPTTAAMVLAYYKILPKWPFSCKSPYQHTSYYGGYVAAKYMYREVNYANYTANDASGHTSWGGYGYMWSTGSPNSRMRDYYVNHGISGATQSWSTSWATTIAELNAGYPFTMCVWLTSSGHLVLALGQATEDHTLIFNDPYGNKNTPDYPSYDGKNAKYDWPGYNNGYKNLDYTGQGRSIPWTITQRYTPPLARDTLVDDHYFENGFYLHNASPSRMEFWRDKKNGGYNNGHFWYTYTTSELDTCYATWTPNLPSTKQYEVYAYIPYSNCTEARYKVYHKDGMTQVNINQKNYSNQWVSLGVYNFNAGTGGYVKLGDGSSIRNQAIVFDAMVWTTPGTYTEIEDETSIAQKFELEQNYPNPFNPTTVIRYTIPSYVDGQISNISLKVYDVLGQEVETLVNEKKEPGTYQVEFDGSKYSSGIYFYKLQTGEYSTIRKMVLLK